MYPATPIPEANLSYPNAPDTAKIGESQTCRERHLKCNYTTTPCDNCARAGRECRPSSTFLFKPTPDVDRLQRLHRRRKNSARPPSSSPTRQDRPSFNIINETGNTISAHAKPTVNASDKLPSRSSEVRGRSEGDAGTSPPALWDGLRVGQHSPSNGDDGLHSREQFQESILQSIAEGAELGLPANSPGDTRTTRDARRLSTNPSSIPSPGTDTVHYRPFPLSRSEADLFRHFVQVWGPLIDSTDESRQFSTCVPYLAKTESPCLMYAILALVSCQLSRTAGYSLQTSKLYRKKCAQVLVSILLDDPDSVHEASIFATYVLLRVYDHLHIAATLTERRPESLFSDALALSIQPWHAYSSHAALKQAAFWVHLRQDIHVALQLECTIQVDHTLYEQTVAIAVQITEEDLAQRTSSHPPDETAPSPTQHSPEMYNPRVDCAWTNRLVGVTCRLVNYCFNPEKQSISKWTAVMSDLEAWNLGKPPAFEPYYDEACDGTEDRPFPTIHLLNDWHVLGLMYYHLAIILLKSHRPGRQCQTKDPRAIAYDTRDDLIRHIKILCGIVWTNPTDQALLIIPAMLNVSACFLSDVQSQKGVLDLLDMARRRIGAHTSTISSHLMGLWNNRTNGSSRQPH